MDKMPKHKRDHFAITEKNIKEAIAEYKALGFKLLREFEKPNLMLLMATMEYRGLKLEILQPYNPNNEKIDNPLIIKLHEEGINHICDVVDDIDKAHEEAEKNAEFITPIIDSKYFFYKKPNRIFTEIKQG